MKVAEDLATADLYVVIMGTPGKQSAALAALQNAAGKMRGRVGKAMSTRTVPLLRFHLDEAYEEEKRVLALIQKAEAERKAAAGDDDAGESAADAPDADAPAATA